MQFARTASGRDLSAGADLTVDWLLFELPGGTLAERTRRAGILYDARLADRWENRGFRPAVVVDGRVFGLHQHEDELRYPSVAQQMILPYPGGFVREDVILPGPGVPPPYQGGRPHDGALTFFDAGGRELRQARFHRDLGLPDRWHYGLMATDQESGRILVYSGERVWLLDREARGVLASSPPDTFVEAAGFWDPEHLVMVGSAPGGYLGPYMRIWRVRGDTIEIEAEQPDRLAPYALAVLPARGEIVTVDIEGRLRWLDGQTLAAIGVPGEAAAEPLWYSPDGRSYACPASDRTGVNVFIAPPVRTPRPHRLISTARPSSPRLLPSRPLTSSAQRSAWGPSPRRRTPAGGVFASSGVLTGALPGRRIR